MEGHSVGAYRNPSPVQSYVFLALPKGTNLLLLLLLWRMEVTLGGQLGAYNALWFPFCCAVR